MRLLCGNREGRLAGDAPGKLKARVEMLHGGATAGEVDFQRKESDRHW